MRDNLQYIALYNNYTLHFWYIVHYQYLRLGRVCNSIYLDPLSFNPLSLPVGHRCEVVNRDPK